MSKKPTRTKPTKPQPEAAQIKAIERLIDAKEDTKAIQRLEPLIRRFPDHSGLRRLLVEALQRSKGMRAAGLAAFEWAESRPHSVPAQEALLYFASRLGHVLLAERTLRVLRTSVTRMNDLVMTPDLLAELLTQPDGTLATIEQVEQFEIGKLYLDAQDFAGAIDRLEGIEILTARNNHAMALFHLGRIDEALAGFMAGWKADADNLFALGWVARLRLYRGDEVGAYGLTTPLAAATARRLDDALLQLDALLLLRQDAAAWDAYTRYAQCHWFGLGENYPRAILHHFAACAASRLGQTADAQRLWQEALKLAPDFALARHNSTALQRERHTADYPSVFDLSRALPLTWLEELRATPKEDAADKVDTLTAANGFLEELYFGADDSLRRLIGVILMDRARRADPDAARLLKDFARLPIGTKDDRFGFLRVLQEQGLIQPTDPIDYWDGKEVRQINLFNMEIHREPEPSDLPDDLQMLLEESIERYNAADYARAEALLTEILARVPTHAVAKGNLAAIRFEEGRPEEARQLIREVIADHPDYLHARCNLANLLILDGELEEANELLEGLASRQRIHINDLFVLYGSMALLHRARGEREVADSLIATLEKMVQNENDARNLSFAKELQKSVGRGSNLVKMITALGRLTGKPSKGRGR